VDDKKTPKKSVRGSGRIPPELLNSFYESMTDANLQFRNGKDGGRAGVIKALDMAIAFLCLFEPLQEDGLLDPLVNLDNALRALDHNNVQPLLVPRRRHSRSPASEFRIIIQSLSIYVSDSLIALGVPQREACKRVAKVLEKKGIKSNGSSGSVSERTIRGWRERASKELTKDTSLAKSLRATRESDPLRSITDKPNTASEKMILMILGATLDRFRARDAH
jgi:hypothetical protein